MTVAARNYLFLQGPVGPFFSDLADRLSVLGHRTHRIHFNGGDRLFWREKGAIDFRDSIDRWPDFLSSVLTRNTITDILLFGDCRPLHRIAVKTALLRSIQVHVFEEGYLRPNWITLEQSGVNGYSSLPRDPAWFRQAALSLPPEMEPLQVRNHFARRAREDVLYNCSLVLSRWRYPGFRTHRPWHPFTEYAAGAKRFFGKRATRSAADQRISELLAKKLPYYLFPLQLDADSQIRFHSPYGRMAPAIIEVIESFSRSAPMDALLVLTEHPLDNAVVNLRDVARQAAARAGASDRIIYLQGGSPEPLVQGARALVTVNSTIGALALGLGIAVKALGIAIYDIPQIGFQGNLDDFWTRSVPPDPATFDAFRRVVAARTQINGGFYSRQGVALAVDGTIQRLAKGNLAQGPHCGSVASLELSLQGQASLAVGET